MYQNKKTRYVISSPRVSLRSCRVAQSVVLKSPLCYFLQIDIHIMTQPPSGEWVYFDTELTNSSGRVSYVIPENRRLSIGVYPVKMVVRYAKSHCYLIKSIFYLGISSFHNNVSFLLSYFALTGVTTRLPTAISLLSLEEQSLLCSVLTALLLPVCL